MTDVRVRVENSQFLRKGVNDTVFLHVRSVSYPYASDISSQNSPGADVAFCRHFHVADQHRIGMDEGLGIKDGTFSFKLIESHMNLISV